MTQKRLLNAIKAALKAGEAILEIYNNPNSDFGIEMKADNSPLTLADKKSDAIIREYLSAMPYPILSEEEKALPYCERKCWSQLWIVDPLDGTKEFIKRNGEFTVNIAFVEDCKPTAGIIYVPVKGTLYFGDTTLGAYRIDHITSLAADDTLDTLISQAQKLPLQSNRATFTVVASRSHLSADTADFIATLQREHHDIETISIGSSLKICLVCEGSADIYPRFAPTMEWDTAAGHAIARAAGKELYNIDRKTPLQYNKEDLLNPWFIVE
ncbi:MAG: 3'(2'),5'-bisphosphate nucleotidase CysQ [Coprobacter sp.]|nr:3'(2'),5'-bisphosphate nucleotidase CysQ [Coprobacter sp.]